MCTASSLDFQLNSVSSLLVEGACARVVAGYSTLMASPPLPCHNSLRGSGVHQWNWIYLGLCVCVCVFFNYSFVAEALQARSFLVLSTDPFQC